HRGGGAGRGECPAGSTPGPRPALRGLEHAFDAGDGFTAEPNGLDIDTQVNAALAAELHALAGDVGLFGKAEMAQIGRDTDIAAAADRIFGNASRRRKRAHVDRRARLTGSGEYRDAGRAERSGPFAKCAHVGLERAEGGRV